MSELQALTHLEHVRVRTSTSVACIGCLVDCMHVRILPVPMPLVSVVDSQVLPRVFGAVEEEEMGQTVS